MVWPKLEIELGIKMLLGSTGAPEQQPYRKGSGLHESGHTNCFGNTLGYKTNPPEEQNTLGKHPGTLSKHSWPRTSFQLN